jgi:hypothetical protein
MRESSSGPILAIMPICSLSINALMR